MKIEPIPGFSALKFKAEVQEEIQAELAGLTPEQRIRKIRQDIEKGPLGDWWKQLRAAKRAERRAALEQEEREEQESVA
jgi:hypothetical protein